MFKILFRFIISLLLISALAYGGYYLYKKNKVKVDAFFKNSYEKVENFIEDKIKKDNKEDNKDDKTEEITCDHHFVFFLKICKSNYGYLCAYYGNSSNS